MKVFKHYRCWRERGYPRQRALYLAIKWRNL
jgi:hypothetical protein